MRILAPHRSGLVWGHQNLCATQRRDADILHEIAGITDQDSNPKAMETFGQNKIGGVRSAADGVVLEGVKFAMPMEGTVGQSHDIAVVIDASTSILNQTRPQHDVVAPSQF